MAPEREDGPAAATAAVLASPLPGGVDGNPPGCRAVVAGNRPGRVAVDVDGAGPGPSLLALNQSWDEGWSARLDGAPAPLLRSDVSLQAVVVPAGHHRVELDYRNRRVALGILLSAAGLAVTLGLAVAGRRSIGPK